MQSIVLLIAACCAAASGAWYLLGPFGIVFAAPLFGIAFARPLIDAVANGYGLLRARAFRGVDGKHYVYRGSPINVAQDARGFKWLRLTDVRNVIPNLQRDESLQQLLGAGVQQILPDQALRVKAETLVIYLNRSMKRDTGKFSQWVQQMIVNPAHKVRQQSDATTQQPK
jgi:hypothetical protein